MANFIDGISNTHNTDQYHKQVVEYGKDSNQLLGLISANGLQGTNFDQHKWTAWNYNDIDATSRNNLEGQDAPDGKVFQPQNRENQLEIFHEAFGITYSQSTNDVLEYNSAVNLSFQQSGVIRFVNKQMSRSILVNTKVKPATINDSPKMDGLVNVITAGGNVKSNKDQGTGLPTKLTNKDVINESLQMAYNKGELGTKLYAVMNPTVKQQWNKIFVGNFIVNGNTPVLNQDTVATDFGNVTAIMDKNFIIPTLGSKILLLSVDQLFLLFKNIVRFDNNTGTTYGGYMFLEKLAKTGAKDKWQIYGEATLEYGSEFNHAMITDIDFASA